MQFATAALAQRNRIVGPINNSQRVALTDHIHPRASHANDQGRASASLVMPYVTVILKQTPAQLADLNQLLADQQDPNSANYHKWLTPEQYADRFGVSQDDIKQVTAWLQQQNLTVKNVARARNWVSLSGTAGAVEAAFKTEIHNYDVNGEMHFANATNPSIPAALDQVVSGIRGLTNFRLKPAARTSRQVIPKGSQPNYNSSKGSHFLAPDDFSVIYNVQPLYASGIDGTNQKIAVVGQTQIKISDIQQFRSYFGLAANDTQIVQVPNTTDPGVSQSDLPEADLDVEWAGAVARNATIIYVYSDDVEVSAQYAIDQNLAPVLSMSYGLCENLTTGSDARIQQSYARQANAQGMTWIAASGDSGAADCVASSTRTSYGLAVDLPGSLPEVTGIGGTTFNEGSGAFWNSSNSATRSSAMSYIPETTWNDSAADGMPSASGGGASAYWAKPSWQIGVGVPSDGARDVPDISLSGSADHDAYMIYSGGTLQGVGGTSVGAPSFAGMAALLNQYLVAKGAQSAAGLGNMNPKLYTLAQTSPGAFHDITTGDNLVNPCPSRARTCTPTPVGFAAGTGYDQATGLGSVDAFALVTSWSASGTSSRLTANVALTSDAVSITTSDTSVLTATVKGANGVTPTGSITFQSGSTTLGTATLTGSGGAATATLTVTGTQLAVGTDTVTAQYSGDGTFASGTASVTVTVATVSASGTPSVTSLTNGASFRTSYAPGMILTVFGTNLSTITGSAPRVPLPTSLGGVSATINGVIAPIYYVSPGQLNLQIPYETVVNSNATLVLSNNGQTTSTTFRAAAAAPGIFVSNGAPVPTTTAAHNAVATLYITGDGAVSPTLATGATPAPSTAATNLPKPTQSVSLTVGGIAATIQFVGIPAGLVGVTQINYVVPNSVAAGAQPVIVTVGGVASAAATLTVTQ